jgi:hypothetical protein
MFLFGIASELTWAHEASSSVGIINKLEVKQLKSGAHHITPSISEHKKACTFTCKSLYTPL